MRDRLFPSLNGKDILIVFSQSASIVSSPPSSSTSSTLSELSWLVNRLLALSRVHVLIISPFPVIGIATPRATSEQSALGAALFDRTSRARASFLEEAAVGICLDRDSLPLVEKVSLRLPPLDRVSSARLLWESLGQATIARVTEELENTVASPAFLIGFTHSHQGSQSVKEKTETEVDVCCFGAYPCHPMPFAMYILTKHRLIELLKGNPTSIRDAAHNLEASTSSTPLKELVDSLDSNMEADKCSRTFRAKSDALQKESLQPFETLRLPSNMLSLDLRVVLSQDLGSTKNANEMVDSESSNDCGGGSTACTGTYTAFVILVTLCFCCLFL